MNIDIFDNYEDQAEFCETVHGLLPEGTEFIILAKLGEKIMFSSFGINPKCIPGVMTAAADKLREAQLAAEAEREGLSE